MATYFQIFSTQWETHAPKLAALCGLETCPSAETAWERLPLYVELVPGLGDLLLSIRMENPDASYTDALNLVRGSQVAQPFMKRIESEVACHSEETLQEAFRRLAAFYFICKSSEK